MANIGNCYEEIARHSRVAHRHDLVFAIIFAIATLFAVGSLRVASQHVVDATPPRSTCLIAPAC